MKNPPPPHPVSEFRFTASSTELIGNESVRLFNDIEWSLEAGLRPVVGETLKNLKYYQEYLLHFKFDSSPKK